MKTMFAIPYAHPRRWLRVSTPFGEAPLFAKGIDSLKHIWSIADAQREYTEGMPQSTRVKMALESYSKALIASCLHLIKAKKPMIVSYRCYRERRIAAGVRKMYTLGFESDHFLYHNSNAHEGLQAISKELGYEVRVFTWEEDDVTTDRPPMLYSSVSQSKLLIVNNEDFQKGLIF